MIFIWDGVPVEKVSGKWISRCWAMRGPVVTGNMMGKEIPEPLHSQIEKDFQNYLKEERERDKKRPSNRILPPSRITWTRADNVGDCASPIKQNTKAIDIVDNELKSKRNISDKPKVKKKPELSISGLEALIKKERKIPRTPLKKKGGVIGGMSLGDSNNG